MYGEMGGEVLPASMLTEILFAGALGLCAPNARTDAAPAASTANNLLAIAVSLSAADRIFRCRLPLDRRLYIQAHPPAEEHRHVRRLLRRMHARPNDHPVAPAADPSLPAPWASAPARADRILATRDTPSTPGCGAVQRLFGTAAVWRRNTAQGKLGEPPATALVGEIPKGYPPASLLSDARDRCLRETALRRKRGSRWISTSSKACSISSGRSLSCPDPASLFPS